MAESAGGSSRDEALGEEAAAWLARLRGPASAEHQNAFEDWYNADPRHAAAYESVLASWDFAGLSATTPAAQARGRLGRTPARRRHAIAAAVAATVVALLAFGAFAVRGPAQPVEFASRAGEIRSVDLADGSHITLDTGSLVQAAYSPHERRVALLRGRARFTVAHGDLRPFVVAAGSGLVIAHGTVFDVAFDGRRVTVSLLQGSIEVRPTEPADNPDSPDSRMLAPGQRAIIESGKVSRVTEHPMYARSDWPSGMLSIDNAPLGDVIDAANRFGANRIVLGAPALAQLRFTGTFQAAKTEQLARMVAAMFDLELTRANDGTIVLAASGTTAAGVAKKVPG
jgi:transmembrane sensor